MPSHRKAKRQFNSKFICTCFLSSAVFITYSQVKSYKSTGNGNRVIREINAKEIPVSKSTIAITGAMIVDGNGGEPIHNGCVVVKDGKITEVGVNGKIKIPGNAEIIDAKGLALLPGFIDSHFHLDEAQGPSSDVSSARRYFHTGPGGRG